MTGQPAMAGQLEVNGPVAMVHRVSTLTLTPRRRTSPIAESRAPEHHLRRSPPRIRRATAPLALALWDRSPAGPDASAAETGAVGLLHRRDAPGPHLAPPPASVERPVRSAQAQPVGQAPRALGHARPPVHVEQRQRLEQLAPGAAQRLLHRGGGTASSTTKARSTSLDGNRLTGATQRAASGRVARGARPRSTSSHPTRRRSASSPKSSQDTGVHLAHHADDPSGVAARRPGTDEPRRTGRVQPRRDRGEAGIAHRGPGRPPRRPRPRRRRPGPATPRRRCGRRRPRRPTPTASTSRSSITVVPGARQGPGHALGVGRGEDVADLEEPHLALAAIGVEGERAAASRAGGSAQHALVGGERVGDPHPAFDPHPAAGRRGRAATASTPRARPARPPRRGPGAARAGTGVRPTRPAARTDAAAAGWRSRGGGPPLR